MMTQSVMTQAANLFGNTAVSVSSKGKQTGSGFNLMIDSNLKAPQSTTSNDGTISARKTPVPNTGPSSASKSNDADNTDRSEAVTADTEPSKAQAVTEDTNTSKLTKSTVKDSAKVLDQSDKTKTATKSDPIVDEQLLAGILGMLQTAQQTVMKTLNLSQEEFNQLLTDQGMSLTDLLEPEKLQQLILASNGETDISAVLTDESLAAMMKDLISAVDEIKVDANLGLTKEQIDTVLVQVEKASQANSQTDAGVQTPQAGALNSTDEVLTKQPEAANSVNRTKEETATVNTETEQDNQVGTAKLEDTKENNNGTQKDTGRDEKKEFKASDQFQTFVDNLVKSSQGTQVDFSGNMVQVTELRDIANQIIERIKVSITTDQTSMELQLNPENLGKINLTVQSKNGVMTAQFVVQNEISKAAIEGQLHTLRETLNTQGIKVEAIEVTVASYAFDQNSQDNAQNQAETEKNNTGKQITMDEALSMTDTLEDASDVQDVMGVRGSQIDYSA